MDNFIKEHRKALVMLPVATEDYIGARCCLLNGIITCGYILAAQALEKLLKCYILLLLPNENFKKNKAYPLHDLQSLLKKLIEISGSNLSQFDNLCFVLTKCFHGLRYPDNPSITTFQINSISTNIIDEVDEMFLYLFVELPVPDSLKYGTGILGILLVSQIDALKNWIVRSNKAYLKRADYFGKPLSWWRMDANQRAKLPEIKILNIEIKQG